MLHLSVVLLLSMALSVASMQSAGNCDQAALSHCLDGLPSAHGQHLKDLQRCTQQICGPAALQLRSPPDQSQVSIYYPDELIASSSFTHTSTPSEVSIYSNVPAYMCSNEYISIMRTDASEFLPTTSCSMQKYSCVCSAYVTQAGEYVAINNLSPIPMRTNPNGSIQRTHRRLRPVRLRQPLPPAHNVWLEGANRVALIALTALAFVGNFIFLVHVFWFA